jgi:hypothetical protein
MTDANGPGNATVTERLAFRLNGESTAINAFEV